MQPQITSCGCTVISFFCILAFLVIQETLQSMIYSAEVLQMNLFIYLLGSSTDYHYISLQPGGIFANNGRAGGWHWQQWTKTIITSFELFPSNQIIIPYIYIYLPTPGQNHYAVRFRLSTASFQSYLTNCGQSRQVLRTFYLSFETWRFDTIFCP